MPSQFRPRRAALTVPAHRRRLLAKAETVSVDEVILDLEDGVPASAKEEARHNGAAALAALPCPGPLRAVRINGCDSRWALADLHTIVTQAGQHLDAVVVPKVESRDHVVFVDMALTQLEGGTGLPLGSIGIEAQIETAAGIAALAAIAGASPRLVALALGTGDLTASLGMPEVAIGAPQPDYPGDQWHGVSTLLLVHARAHGLQAIAGPFGDLDRPAVHQVVARRARSLGFDGMWVIHPSQIPTATAAFSATPDEVQRARRILRAVEAADGGATMHDGQMVDEASRQIALRVLARAPDGLDS